MTLIGNYGSIPTLLNNIINANMGMYKPQNGVVFNPKTNIWESENDYNIEVALPGYSKDVIKIDIDKNMLTISSKKNETEENETEEKYIRREFETKEFSKSFNLAENTINEDAISANFENGVLRVTLPKREEIKPKTIDVKIK